MFSQMSCLMTFCLDLSLYELHRTPQEAITDDTEITISPRSLHSELMCPICLDMLKNTMTTKEVSTSGSKVQQFTVKHLFINFDFIPSDGR